MGPGRIREGLARLERGVRLRQTGEYQVQAAIAAVEVTAPHADAIDWTQIAELYGALAALNPSPVIELNRAVAVGLASGTRVRTCSSRCSAIRRSSAINRCTRRTPTCCAARVTSRALRAPTSRPPALTTNAVERQELDRRLGEVR